jgi:hypothetical protein
VEQWPVPQQVCYIYTFITFSNFYQRFIESFFQVHLLTAFTKKEIPFISSPTCQRLFERLKDFVSAPVFHHFDPERKIIVETKASNLVIAGVFTQYDNDGILYPVTYFSRKYFTTEINCEIYNKKLLVIVRTFKEWCSLLKGSLYTIEVISDH